jgi:radical SAM superfamily enzyme YgiQ (UPF0313 family)
MSAEKTAHVALISLFGLDFGVRSISSYLKARGHRVSLISFGIKGYPLGLVSGDHFSSRPLPRGVCDERDLHLLISKLGELSPAVVGVSLTATTFRTAREVTKAVRERLGLKVVWGGVHAIVRPEECVRWADMVCVGEGEEPMLRLAETLAAGGRPSGIPGLWIKDGDGIEKNPMPPLISDLDSLPFPDFADRGDKFLIDGGRLAPETHIASAYEINSYPVMTSRGCMYACSFCSNSVLRRRYEGKGNYLRRRGVGGVIRELRYAAERRQFDRVRFWDDIFTFDAAWIDEFCARYPREIGKRFTCYTHPLRTDRDILRKLRDAGLGVVDLGIQSGSEETSRALFSRANQSNPALLDFARFADGLGLTARYDVISDNPYESDRDEETTAELLLRLPRPYQIQLYSLCWFPGTPLTDKAVADGTIKEEDQEQYTSKALNHFHMHIPFSRDARARFWNCVKAMAVSVLFPPAAVRACMRSGFLRKYPAVLYSAARLWVRLFSRYGPSTRKGGFPLEKKTPYTAAGNIIYMGRDTVDANVITGDASCLFSPAAVDHSLFPEGGDDPAAFRLRLRAPGGPRGPSDFIVMFLPYDDFYKASPPKTMWLMRVDAGGSAEADVRCRISYPELVCAEGSGAAARLAERGVVFPEPGRQYALVLRHARKPYTVIDTLLIRWPENRGEGRA